MILFRKINITLCVLSVILITGCVFPSGKKEAGGSIFDRTYMLSVQAEAFEEYEWNGDSREAYSRYLTILNEDYFSYDYEKCILGLYSVIEMYQYDARFYILLAECLARTGDARRANDALEAGSGNIAAFSRHPGIARYSEELAGAGSRTQAGGRQQPPKGFFDKAVGVLTWIPRKIKGLF